MIKICRGQCLQALFNGRQLCILALLLPMVTFGTDLSEQPTENNKLEQQGLKAWLLASRIPSPAQEALLLRYHLDPSANQLITELDSVVYSLAHIPLSPKLPSAIRVAKTDLAQKKARQGLLQYAAGASYAKIGYTQREAVAKALMHLDNEVGGRLLPGIQSRATALRDIAVALVWTDAQAVSVFRQKPPSHEQFLTAYCEALYPTAQAIFLQREYDEALKIYRSMHDLDCPRPLPYYLDAAECFLHQGQLKDAARMSTYLLDQPRNILTAALVERAGDILSTAGKQKEAETAYNLAFELLSDAYNTIP